MMNDRIKELVKKCGGVNLDEDGNVLTHFLVGHQIEKFAELIVRQMLDVTDAHTEVFQTDRDKALIEHIKQSVKTHFGVEE